MAANILSSIFLFFFLVVMGLIPSTIVAFLLVQYQYSQTSLQWPSWGQIKGSITERRPLWECRGVMWHLLFCGGTQHYNLLFI